MHLARDEVNQLADQPTHLKKRKKWLWKLGFPHSQNITEVVKVLSLRYRIEKAVLSRTNYDQHSATSNHIILIFFLPCATEDLYPE